MPISIEADSTLPQGYLKVNGTTAATVTSTGLTTASLQDNAVTTSKINNAAITAAKLDGAQTGSAPIYGCRAWVNFDGTKDTTGATSTANTNRLIRASGNVTSVLRNSAGDYTITFTTAMPDANYCLVGNGGDWTSANAAFPIVVSSATAPTTSAIRITNQNTASDHARASVAIIR
jgi:hypothetical protein